MIKWLLHTFWGTAFATFLISMVPIIELRGGIPFGVGHGLPLWIAYGAAVLGNMLPIPFILLFLEHIFNWLRKYEKTRSLVERMERKAHLNGQKVQKYRSLGLFILVAIPLPGTGAWTGALVASVLKIPLKKSIPIIFLGVCTAGLAILSISYGVTAIF